MLAYAFLLIFVFHYIVRRSFYCHSITLPPADHYCAHSTHQNACQTQITGYETPIIVPCDYPPPPPLCPSLCPPPPPPCPPRCPPPPPPCPPLCSPPKKPSSYVTDCYCPPPPRHCKRTNRKKCEEKKIEKLIEKKEKVEEQMNDNQAKAIKVSNANITIQGVILTVVLTSRNMKQQQCPITTTASVIPTIVNLYSLWTHGRKYLKFHSILDDIMSELGVLSQGEFGDEEDQGTPEQDSEKNGEEDSEKEGTPKTKTGKEGIKGLRQKVVFALSVILLVGFSVVTSSSCWLKTGHKNIETNSSCCLKTPQK